MHWLKSATKVLQSYAMFKSIQVRLHRAHQKMGGEPRISATPVPAQLKISQQIAQKASVPVAKPNTWWNLENIFLDTV